MPGPRTKIAAGLTDEELTEFLADLFRTPDLTLARIQEKAAARGIEVSIQAAKNFRDAEYAPYLAKLRHAREVAQIAAGQLDAADGASLADAAGGLLSQQIFDLLVEANIDLDFDNEPQLKRAERLSKMIARMRSGDARQRMLEAKLDEMRAEKEERERALKAELERAKNKGGISAETLAEMEERLGLL